MLLRPLAAVFGMVIRVRQLAYRRGWLEVVRLGRPVIVVGNLTVGGTGKTPLVAWLAMSLRQAGHAVAVISRGHGRAERAVRVLQGDSTVETVGDEALLLAHRAGVPVIVGRDRTAAARRAIELGATVVVADDGLQHLRLARDFEIVVIDGERRFGNGQLLPAGPLRESPRRLASVDAIVVNEAYAGALHTGAAYIGAGDAGAGDTAAADTGAANAGAADTPPIRAPAFRMRLAPEPLKPLFAGGRELPLAAWRGEYVHAVAGLGNPERFFALLRGAGLEVREHSFPDHHQFVASDLDFADGRAIIMTEKDAVKCAGFRLDRAWYLPVSAELEQGARLLARIESLLAACPASGRAQNEGS